MTRTTSLLIDPNDHLIHRDLSWLQFNDRVLAEAEDTSNPLLERLKFLAISSANSDEFFMIRFAGLEGEIRILNRQGETKIQERTRLSAIRNKILDISKTFGVKQTTILNSILQSLQTHRVNVSPITNRSRGLAEKLFLEKILPLLVSCEPNPSLDSVTLFDSNYNLDAVENLRLALLFPGGPLKILPRTLPTIVWAKEGKKLIAFFTDDLLFEFAGKHLDSSKQPLLFRLTRNADLTLSLHNEDPSLIPSLVRESLRGRDRGRPVRLEVRSRSNLQELPQLVNSLKLESDLVFQTPLPLALRGLFELYTELKGSFEHNSALYYPPLKQMIPDVLASSAPILKNLQVRDYLLHHPYDSFEAYTNFIRAATNDPEVTSIQQTIYRIEPGSSLVELLKQAAAVKRVRICIEPRARFDESNNLRLAEELSAAGAEVVLASGKLKLHAKLGLVTKNSDFGESFLTHLSTGNYNAKTSREYEDLAIITSNQAIGKDIARLFDSVCRGEIPDGMKQIVLAPTGLQRKISSLIKAETAAAKEGKPARIFAKVNALVDESVIEALYEASQSGVRVDLVVRGACSLVPGLAGISEGIRVISIVDRFLEHSRIYYFQNSGSIYISSADWMPRNFFSRLEVAFPVLDPRLFEFMTQYVLPFYLGDRVKARILTRNGTWRSLRDPSIDGQTRAQLRFQQLAIASYAGTPLV